LNGGDLFESKVKDPACFLQKIIIFLSLSFAELFQNLGLAGYFVFVPEIEPRA
jgi:hypothetical protein